MIGKTLGRRFLTMGAVALLATAAAYAQAPWWNLDYTKRVPVTISNPGGTPTPTPTSAEVTLSIPDLGFRADRSDIRVLYWNGTANQELDRVVFKELPSVLTENLNAGASSYAALPAGTKVTFTANPGNLDDNFASLTLPFSFPFQNGTSNQLLVHIDGFISPGQTTDPGRPDGIAKARTDFAIMPWQSDLAITDTATQGVYYFADATRAVIRWEVQESASGPIIAKFAVVLTPDGSIRFVYGDPVTSPGEGIAGPTGYSPIKYGVGVGDANLSIVTAPTFPAVFTNHADILYTQSFGVTEASRVVFRLVDPIPAGGASTGQYFVYYGNPSPESGTVKSEVRNVFDHTVDFLSAANVVGQPAPDWEAGEQPDQIKMTVQELNGVKQGLLTRGTVSHPRAIVKEGAMPKFLNAELLANMTPGGGENEMFPMLRTPQSTTNSYPDPNRAYAGGYGYFSDGFGPQQGLVSLINPAVDRGPANFSGEVPGPNITGTPYLTLFRAEGQLLSGKRWAEGSEEPFWTKYKVDREAYSPSHGGEEDPIYDQPGGTGIGSYSSNFIAVEYIALRELRDLSQAAGAAENAAPSTSRIAGTVVSSKGNEPIANATIVINDGTTSRTFTTNALGQYSVTLPAGTYTVSASSIYHTTVDVANVTPGAAAATNFTLPYVGATITGVLRDGLTAQPMANAKVTATDATGLFAGTTTSNANGEYSVQVATGGTYHINWYSPTGIGTTVGVPRQVTVASGGSATFNSAGQFVGNGDAEMPLPNNAYPDGWSNNEFGQPAPDAYEYVHAVGANAHLNHTPGGHWSLAVRNPNGINAWLPPPTGFYDLPVQNDAFNTTVSFWVYFTQTGQEARMRLRNNLVPSAITVIAGNAPPPENDNQGGTVGGLVPINQWYEIRKAFPAGTVTDPPGTIEMQLYSNGSATVNSGTIYFDDLTITRTPIASALGRVVDENGSPVSGVRIGQITKADTAAFPSPVSAPNFLEGPFSVTDENGNFTFFAPDNDPVTLGAWAFPTITNDAASESGYIVATANFTPEANPTTRTTLTLNRGTNVADGSTAIAVPNSGNPADSVDNDFSTRWASPGGTDASQVRMTWDLGSAQTLTQVEIYWEAARGDDYDIRVGNDPSPDSTSNPLIAQTTDIGGRGWPAFDYTGFPEGPIHVFKLPAGTSARYIHFIGFGYASGLGNYSIIELRALNNVAPPLPITDADVQRAIRIAGGLDAATPADIARLDADDNGSIDLLDAVSLNRQLRGL